MSVFLIVLLFFQYNHHSFSIDTYAFLQSCFSVVENSSNAPARSQGPNAEYVFVIFITFMFHHLYIPIQVHYALRIPDIGTAVYLCLQ